MFDVMMELEEKLTDHQSYYNSTCGEHECLYQMSFNSYYDISLKTHPHGGVKYKK